MSTVCTKRFENFPAAHRQWAHPGHCRFIHGHNWTFEVSFGLKPGVPDRIMIVDFGKMSPLKDRLTYWFDHTFLTTVDDPELPTFERMALLGDPPDEGKIVFQLRVMPSVSTEGIAAFVMRMADEWLEQYGYTDVQCMSVKVEEDSKNFASITR